MTQEARFSDCDHGRVQMWRTQERFCGRASLHGWLDHDELPVTDPLLVPQIPPLFSSNSTPPHRCPLLSTLPRQQPRPTPLLSTATCHHTHYHPSRPLNVWPLRAFLYPFTTPQPHAAPLLLSPFQQPQWHPPTPLCRPAYSYSTSPCPNTLAARYK